ncbi:MAG TPA: caspase family protein [Chitinophagaceae bacterium]|nr:caspase family protein [Chitinophagaceae bacterium]
MLQLMYQLLFLFFFLFANVDNTYSQINFTKSDGKDYGPILKFSPNGDFILSGGKNKIGIWYSSTSKLSESFSVKGVEHINDLAFIGNDTLLISHDDADIIIYDLKNSVIVSTLKGHKRKVTSMEVDIEARQLISSSMDETTILWDLNTKTIKQQFKDHKNFVIATAVNQNTGRFASCGADGMVNIYKRNGERILTKKLTEKWLWSIAFSIDGNSLVLGGENDVYILSDIDQQNPKISTFSDVKGRSYSVDFSPDGKYLAIGTTKRKIYLFEWETKRLITERLLDNGEVNNIDFDPNGKSMVTSHSTFQGIIKWDLRSLNILPSKYINNVNDRTPPQIYVSNPPRVNDDRVVVYNELVKLQGTVIDESGVFKVLVNSVNTPISENGTFTINLPLSYAENPITIEAYDINKNVSLKRFTIVRKDVAGSDYNPEAAKNFLLVIGINNYINWRPLHNAVNDANAIAGTLSGLYNFNFSDITLLLDSQATRNNIYNALRSYAEKIGPQDNFMIYYSGHGYFDKILNEGYWVPVDADKKSSGSFLSNSDILKIIKSINSQHTLLVADACFSGSLFNESSRGYAENVEKFRSRWGFASGRLEVVSDGEIGKNSPFAQSLLNFLRTNNKDKIPISELIYAVKMKVPEGSEQTPIGNPLKNVGDEGGEFIFYKRK